MKQLSSITVLIGLIFMFGINIQAQYLTQQFSQALTAGNLGGGTIVSNTSVTSDPVYVNNPASNTQFTFLSTNSDLASIGISGDGVMRIVRPGSGTVYIVRNTDFTGSPTSLMVKLDFNAETTAGTSGGVLEFMIGQNFPNSNSNPSATDKHSVFFVNTKSPTGTPGTWGVTPVSASSASAFNTTETISWYINNSGSIINYPGPDGSANTIADDTYDLWVGNTLYYNDQAANSATAALNHFEIRIAGGNGTYTIDNLLIDDIPPFGTPPIVTTIAISDITQTTASSGGNVTSEGTSPVTVRGVCWSTSENPTISDSKTEDGTGPGSFTSSITGLAAGTTYYVRAYATNLAGTSYGNQETFTTLSGVAAIVLSSDNPAVPSGDITTSSQKNPVYKFNLTVTVANTQLNQVDFTTAGTYTSSDISKLQLWFNTADNLGTAVQIGTDITSNLGGVSNLSFGSLTQDINAGETGYLWITADVFETATIGNSLSIDALNTAGLTFSSGNKSGTAFAGGLQTFIEAANPDVYFRTKATGDWNATSTWETSPDSVAWVDAALTPTNLSRYIHVRSPHTVTVTDTVSVDQIIVDESATIIVNGTPVVFTILDGPDAVDMLVNGLVKSTGTANPSPGPHTVNAEGVLQFGSTGVYEHNQNAGAIPLSVWGSGSTMKLTGTTGSAPANRNQDYHHLIFDTPGLSSNLNMGFNNNVISGNITIVSTSASNRWQLCGPPVDSTAILDIMGDVIHLSGNFATQGTSSANTTIIINHYGNIIATAGNFSIARGSQSGTGTTSWYMHNGSITMSDLTTQNSNPTGARFVFTGNTIQNLTLTNMTYGGGGLPVVVDTDAKVNLGSSVIAGTGIFTLIDLGGINTSMPNGFDDNLITTGTITLSSSGNYGYNGTVAQVTGSLLPTTVNNLIVNNSAGVTLIGDVTVNGTLAVNIGDLHLDGKTVTLGTNAMLVETAGNTVTDVTGKIITTRDINAPTALNVGGMGAMITSSSDLGITIIERYHFASTQGGNEGIFRVFNIQPTNNTALDATLRFYYDESELNSITESNLTLFKSPNGTINSWVSLGGTVNATDNFVELSSIGDFSYWTLAEGIISTFQLSVNVADGWNMVSIPGLHPTDQNVSTWWAFRDPGANVFRYAGGYQPITDAVPGIGYWMKHAGALTYNTGEEWPVGGIQIVAHDPIQGASGWNLLGGYELSVTAANVTTNPPGLQSGPIYKYSGGYQTATTLDPGYGYWIKLNAAGQIIIPEMMAKGEVVEYFPEDWGRILLTDATGRNYTLYAVKGEVDLDFYEMPPVPPAGNFDIRFGSGRIAEDVNSSVKTIDMSGVTYPLTVRVEGMDIRLMDESGKVVNVNLKSGEDVVIDNTSINKLMVSGELLPMVYSLEQNYPNPFNPSTVIEFSLPENVGNVKLSIYNMLGEKVAELVNTSLTAGKYQYQWNAQNVATGMYIYELRTDNFVSVKKMLLLK